MRWSRTGWGIGWHEDLGWAAPTLRGSLLEYAERAIQPAVRCGDLCADLVCCSACVRRAFGRARIGAGRRAVVCRERGNRAVGGTGAADLAAAEQPGRPPPDVGHQRPDQDPSGVCGGTIADASTTAWSSSHARADGKTWARGAWGKTSMITPARCAAWLCSAHASLAVCHRRFGSWGPVVNSAAAQ